MGSHALNRSSPDGGGGEKLGEINNDNLGVGANGCGEGNKEDLIGKKRDLIAVVSSSVGQW